MNEAMCENQYSFTDKRTRERSLIPEVIAERLKSQFHRLWLIFLCYVFLVKRNNNFNNFLLGQKNKKNSLETIMFSAFSLFTVKISTYVPSAKVISNLNKDVYLFIIYYSLFFFIVYFVCILHNE